MCNLLGTDAASLFWLDSNREPKGFYHSNASAELKDLFISRFDELFMGPEEVNMIELTRPIGPSIGRMLDKDFRERFWRGNVYQYLCVPLGHRHMLDVRVEVDGIGRLLLCGWGKADRPFTKADADALVPVQTLIQHAIAIERSDVRWRATKDAAMAHFITDESGKELFAINPDAEAMLMESHLLRQNISMTELPERAPGFAFQLATAMMQAREPVIHLAIANGRIIARASPTRFIGADGVELSRMFVSLEQQVPVDVLIVSFLMNLSLSPLQREIALYGMQGGARSDCIENFAVSAESLKKHVRAILNETGAANWAELASLGSTVN